MAIRFQKNVLLKNYTTAGVGGPAKYFYKAASVEKLIEATEFANSQNLPVLILGEGSNLLISDAGFPGVVIKNEIKGILGFKQILKVGAGTLLSQLVATTVRQNLAGLQKLAGIPGTVGGAIRGNAGAYGSSIGDCITKVTTFDPANKKLINFTKKQCQFNYRDSIFKRNNLIILGGHFKLIKGLKNLKKESEKILKDRLSKNYWEGKNPGSFFKNILAENLSEEILKLIPQDKIMHGKIPAGFLLESIGAKGMKVGKVEVSLNHANLLINKGGGKTSDFIKLAGVLAKKVKDKYGINLEPEVQIVNY
ncbi:MAG: UDP-N-acetylmuramate dehydrogenase [Candidatus Daviesbacteria bacterium]|nr:UDP-N-acetylmuramate dehydrogenase [Candidatus Daviesbacteria bacterium]